MEFCCSLSIEISFKCCLARLASDTKCLSNALFGSPNKNTLANAVSRISIQWLMSSGWLIRKGAIPRPVALPIPIYRLISICIDTAVLGDFSRAKKSACSILNCLIK